MKKSKPFPGKQRISRNIYIYIFNRKPTFLWKTVVVEPLQQAVAEIQGNAKGSVSFFFFFFGILHPFSPRILLLFLFLLFNRQIPTVAFNPIKCGRLLWHNWLNFKYYCSTWMYNQQVGAGSLGRLSALVPPVMTNQLLVLNCSVQPLVHVFFLEMKVSCNNLHECSASVTLSLQSSSLTATIKKQDLFHTRLNAGMP